MRFLSIARILITFDTSNIPTSDNSRISVWKIWTDLVGLCFLNVCEMGFEKIMSLGWTRGKEFRISLQYCVDWEEWRSSLNSSPLLKSLSHLVLSKYLQAIIPVSLFGD
ncbi:hypothetical protein NPIL_198391 [Nephila pilipes]|uniref:Uncharacterized protein n=1 Tax=Nephila pilipes TaxID=299642 RepID=A0A8X6PRD8_NEPPI|nr:hypothetical protein NPIL_198391 [Nephila pilipes]